MRTKSGPREAQGPSKRSGDKTKFCMYFLQGVCRYNNDTCPFAHSVEEMSQNREMSRNRGPRRKRGAMQRSEDDIGGLLADAPAFRELSEISCDQLPGFGGSNLNYRSASSCPTWPDYTSYADCGASLAGAKAPPQRGRRIENADMGTGLYNGAEQFNFNVAGDDGSRLAGAESFNGSANGSGSRSTGAETFGACANAGYTSGAMKDLGKVQQQTILDMQESPDWPKLEEPMFIVTKNVPDPSYINGCLPAPGLTRPHSLLLTESNLQQHTIEAMMASTGRIDGCPWPMSFVGTGSLDGVSARDQQAFATAAGGINNAMLAARLGLGPLLGS